MLATFSSLDDALQKMLACSIADCTLTPVHGGDINDAFALDTPHGRYFLKRNHSAAFSALHQEAQSLEPLSQSVLAAAKPLALACDTDHAYLLLDWIEEGAPYADFWETFGAGLATLHRTLTAAQFGWEKDTTEDWLSYFRDKKLQPRLDAVWNKLSASTRKASEQLLGKLDSYLIAPPRPQLVHGDLWHGNFMCDANGKPVLIDPQAFYGHGEYDLAMTRLFGGFTPEFYRAYQQENPLADGFPIRLEIYTLPPLLRHLELFGSAYLASCEHIIQKYH